MEYLNRDYLEGLPPESFQHQPPYPWIDMQGTLVPEGYERLRKALPDISTFKRWVGVKRAHGQGSHDRAILHYQPWLELEPPWKEFVAEIQGEFYQSFIRRMCGLPLDQRIILTMEWYYAWEGCSVSPHCDAKRKLATHIFYFNTEEDWKDDWGGRILIMDDGGRLKPHSAPSFDELRTVAALDARENHSLLFQRTEHSWHGVRPLGCPPDHLRKLFIITINVPTFQVWWRRVRGKDPDGYPLRAG